jgi:tetratricopeptide (TPR) repeat protein
LAAPERAKASRDRGHFYAGLGEWDKAASDFKKAIDLGSDDVIGVWAPLAILHLRAGRTDAYRSHCEKLLDRFGRKDNPWVSAICTLAPKAVADLSRPVRIAEKEAARRPWSADFRALLGFALYRQGDMAGAVQRLEASNRFHAGLLGAYPPKLYLAMAYHRLGRSAEAKQLFQAVTKGMEKDAQEVRREWAGVQMQLRWMYQEGMQILRREVEQVLHQDPIAGNDNSENKQEPD